MSELKITDNGKKVDHPRKKSKDLADAVTGAVFNAISHTPKDLVKEIEVHTWSSSPEFDKRNLDNVESSSKPVPEEVNDWLESLKLI